MGVRLRTTLALGVSLLLLLAPAGVRAEPGADGVPPVASAAQGIIELSVIGSAGTFESVRATMSPRSFAPATLRWLRNEHFDPNELIRENRENSAVLIRCWLDFSNPRRARLYFADSGAARFLIRDLQLTGSLDELDREALSQALELSIHALLDDQKAGLTREEARSLLTPTPAAPAAKVETTAPTPAPPPNNGRSARAGLAASLSWQLSKHSSELGWTQGPGLALAYERSFLPFRGALWLSGQYQLEQSYRGDRIGLSSNSLALRTGLELSWPFASDAWFLGGRLGGGLDWTRFSPEPGLVDDSAALTPARSATSPALTCALLVGSELGTRLRLTLGLLADVTLTPVHYDLERDGTRTRAVEGWPVRPGLELALTLH